MDFNSPQIVKLLKQQSRFHQEQLRLIDIALEAIALSHRDKDAPEGGNRGQRKGIKKHRIPWTREIDRLLDGYDEFNLIDLQNDLSEKCGITAAMTITGRNVISNTLTRFIKKGRIEKLGPGVYRVVTESLSD